MRRFRLTARIVVVVVVVYLIFLMIYYSIYAYRNDYDDATRH
jgi:heme/copper-type cytochrome/quinol oxidase subunit 2